VLRFEVAPETLALFRVAMHALRRSRGQPLDDDSALLLMARQVLGGPRDDGRASYQVVLTVCPECGARRSRREGSWCPSGRRSRQWLSATVSIWGGSLGMPSEPWPTLKPTWVPMRRSSTC
jgi:hypothetical protein